MEETKESTPSDKGEEKQECEMSAIDPEIESTGLIEHADILEDFSQIYITEHESEINYSNPLVGGDLCMMIAHAASGNVYNARTLLEKDRSLANKCTWRGDTALMLTACGQQRGDSKNDNQRNRVHIAELLLRYGANVNSRDAENWTALMFAAKCGDTALAELLLSSNANIDATGSDGNTALMLTVRMGHMDTFRALLSRSPSLHCQNHLGYNVLHMACYEGHSSCVTDLLHTGRCGVIANARDEQGRSPLMLALYEGHVEIARSLVLFGCDITFRDYLDKRCSLQLCCMELVLTGQREQVRTDALLDLAYMLVDRGGDVRHWNTRGDCVRTILGQSPDETVGVMEQLVWRQLRRVWVLRSVRKVFGADELSAQLTPWSLIMSYL